MEIKRHIRKRVHFKSALDFYRYRVWDAYLGYKYKRHNYLLSKGVLNGKVAYTGPTLIQLDITNRCNNNCIACWTGSPFLDKTEISQKWRKQELPFKMVKELIDELVYMGTRRIYFAGGGEPFMHPDIMRIIEHAKKKNLECHMNTNFTLIDKEIAKKLIDLNFDHINVSLWSGTPEIYAKTHPNKTEKTFYQIKEMLTLISKHKRVMHLPHINMYNVVFNMNYDEVDKMVELAFNVQADSVQFVPMDPIRGKTDHLLLNDEEKEVVKTKLKGVKERLLDDNPINKAGSNLFICEYEQFLRRISSKDASKGEYESLVDSVPCHVGWGFARVTADGNVNPCLKSNTSVGNIYKQNFREIWNGKMQNEFRYKAKYLKKTDSYFSNINCYKTCDNIRQNQDIAELISSLSDFDKLLMKIIKF